MATRKIVVLGNETLRKTSKPVIDFGEDLSKLLDDMKDTMLQRHGVGIAAVQVGVLRRAIVIELDEGEYLEIINPEILKTKGKVTSSDQDMSKSRLKIENANFLNLKPKIISRVVFATKLTT